MAKRRKKKNKAVNSQPSTPPSADTVSDTMPATTADGDQPAESSSSSAPDRVAVAAASSSAASSTGFLQGTKEELEKVVWPDRQQLISESIAVFLMVSLSAFIFSFIDNLFRWVSTLVFG